MAREFDFSGIWHSSYHYTSTTREGVFTSEHDVKIYRTGNQLVIQSLPNEEQSYILLRLTLDDKILTGSWEEETSPTGYYKGEIYYGALQLIIDEDGDTMRGKWIGFNRKTEVQSGDWELIRYNKTSSGVV